MTIRLEDPDGHRWTVRRSVLHGRDGRGRRLRWRGPDTQWLETLQLARVAELGDVPGIGMIALGVAAAVVIAVLLVFLPFIALGLIEALVLGLLLGGAALAATMFGRPILIRAEPVPGPDDDPSAAAPPDAALVWAVTGWRASRTSRDQVVQTLRAGSDPTASVRGGAVLVTGAY